MRWVNVQNSHNIFIPFSPRTKFKPRLDRTRTHISAGSCTHHTNVGTRNPSGLTRPAQDSSVNIGLRWVNSFIKLLLCRLLFTSGVTLEVWARGKHSWNGHTCHCKGPTSQYTEKASKMMLNPDVDGYTKHLQYRKILRKAQKSNTY